MKKEILDNGLSVYSYCLPATHSVCISLYVKSGSIYENVDNNGISHLLEHLHFRKLGTLTQEELFDKTDLLGTTLCAETGQEYTRYYIKVFPTRFIECLQLFVNIMIFSNWTDEELEAERSLILDEMRTSDSNSPFSKAARLLLWRNHPLSFPVIGNERSLSSLTLNDVVNFKKEHYTKEKMAIVITGNFNEPEIINANQLLSGVVLESNTSIFIKPQLITCSRKPDIKILNENTPNTDVCLNFDIDASINPEALTLLNSILGGGTSSTLQRKIREQYGTPYDIYSEVESHCDISVLKIHFIATAEKVIFVLEQIVHTINQMKISITNDDLMKNIVFYTDNLLFWLDDPEFLNFYYAWDAFYLSDTYNSIEELSKRFSNISISDIMQAAQQIFKPQNSSILLSGKVTGLRRLDLCNVINGLSESEN